MGATDGTCVGSELGLKVGAFEGSLLGAAVSATSLHFAPTHMTVGAPTFRFDSQLGVFVGNSEGMVDGMVDGLVEGFMVGLAVGDVVGASDGVPDGTGVGRRVGYTDG